MKHSKQGFSLIEVLVFLTILSLIFISAVVLGTVSIRNSQNTGNKILASHYAEELLDWLRNQKEIDWSNFSTIKSKPNGVTYCFSKEPIDSWGINRACNISDPLINSLFKREATLKFDFNLQRVNVDIHLKWSEGGNNYDVTTKGVFSLFE